LQIAAANRIGHGQTDAFVRFEIEAGTGQFVDSQAAEAGDLRQPLRRFRNFVEDVGVFSEHRDSLLRRREFSRPSKSGKDGHPQNL
jgi:hypothetical protein